MLHVVQPVRSVAFANSWSQNRIWLNSSGDCGLFMLYNTCSQGSSRLEVHFPHARSSSSSPLASNLVERFTGRSKFFLYKVDQLLLAKTDVEDAFYRIPAVQYVSELSLVPELLEDESSSSGPFKKHKFNRNTDVGAW